MDYIFWLDADDVVLEEDRKKFMALKGHLDSSIDAVSMHYNLAFNSEGDVTFSNRRNRLVKRSNHFKWYGAVHEYLEVGGNIIYSDICITHKSSKTSLSDRNLRIYENMLKRGVTFTPRDLYYYANECYDHQLFERAIEYYNNFLDTNQGWSEDCINACAKIADIFIESDDMDEAIPYILKSFTYDLPRADQCCRLGYIYLSKKDLEKAIFWYDLATKLDVKRVEKIGGFINHACYTWLPHLQLCVCYDLLGNYRSAFYHNEMARKYNPNNSSIIYNKNYLETKIKELGGHYAD
ncbi:tetratricopeptide repeat-containing glycosyltransferase [Scopulibacillus cellulosilyticus]|uniref:Glycosyl transferase n=1 Tax=Scopulibacillus cellulosilyticus TaxID=2665665 RepID=A0ABW2PYA0_9BACL